MSPRVLNRQIKLVSRPTGTPSPANFALVESPVPAAGPGQVLVRSLYLSVDPYMRGRMSERESYVAPFPLGEVLTGGTVGEVVESHAAGFAPGDVVTGMLGWQDYSLAAPEALRKLDPARAPMTTALGILGMPGLTAYFGLLDIADPQAGETVVVSGAAGAVGQIVGQLAKIRGCRVVGIAGGEDKTRYLREQLGFDAAIDYKATPNLASALQAACPRGVDVYFDNVGGPISDAVMALINHGARIPVCGQIALYNLAEAPLGPRVAPILLTKSALMKGFIIGDYAARFAEGAEALARWLAEGKLRYTEHVVEGLEHAPEAFLGLFSGENIGKQLVHVADPTPKA